jgi:hypothetical protein
MKYDHDNGKGYLDYYDLYKKSGKKAMEEKWRSDFDLAPDAVFPVNLPEHPALSFNYGSQPSLFNLGLGRGPR